MKAATLVFSALLIAIGVVLLVETALLGGGIGLVFGTLFALAGALRLFLLLRTRH